VRNRSRHGKRFSIICVSEGARLKDGKQVVNRVDPNSPDPVRLGGISQVIAAEIEARTGIETRDIKLGHVQRGGTPVPDDRVLATEFGYTALELLMAGGQSRLVVMTGRTVTHIPLEEADGKQRLVPPDHHLIMAARNIGTSFGD